MPRYIDADELKKCSYVIAYKDEWHMTQYGEFVELADIENAPTADVVERKRGKWETEIRNIHGHKIPFLACSICGIYAADEYQYCPHCGAEMKGEDDAIQ